MPMSDRRERGRCAAPRGRPPGCGPSRQPEALGALVESARDRGVRGLGHGRGWYRLGRRSAGVEAPAPDTMTSTRSSKVGTVDTKSGHTSTSTAPSGRGRLDLADRPTEHAGLDARRVEDGDLGRRCSHEERDDALGGYRPATLGDRRRTVDQLAIRRHLRGDACVGDLFERGFVDGQDRARCAHTEREGRHLLADEARRVGRRDRLWRREAGKTLLPSGASGGSATAATNCSSSWVRSEARAASTSACSTNGNSSRFPPLIASGLMAETCWVRRKSGTWVISPASTLPSGPAR